MRRSTNIVLACLITLLAQIGVMAPHEAAADVAAPETAATLQLQWALDQVNHPAEPLSDTEIQAHFAPDFLAALDETQIAWVFHSYVAPSGPMSVARYEGGPTETRASALLYGSTGLWRVTFGVEAHEPFLIDDLFFEPLATMPDPAGDYTSWSPLKKALSKAAPEVSFIAAEVSDGQCTPIARVHSEQPLAIASSFKLYVLGTLADQVAAGEASWTDTITLDPALISMPNGDMRYHTPGEQFTVAYVAEQMISQSDNTATDHLINYLGRENVEAAFAAMGQNDPSLNVPLMLTREWFAMRMRFSDDQLDTYARSSVAERRQILSNDADPTASTLAEIEPWPALRNIDSVEWFASAGDLCRALAYLHHAAQDPANREVLNALSLEPGLPIDPHVWTYVGYKGGYETGVYSNSWLLQRDDGRWFVISAIINNPAAEIDGHSLMSLASAAVSLLAEEA